MDKSKKFVGQPILSQILSCISTDTINQASKKHNSNRYYKRIPVRVHLTSLIRKKAETKKSFANMITVIRLHLMSYVALFEFIKDSK